ncbi:MAG: hypothetical protein LLG40_14020 [Deltaproteobacteria bacterium]|nr:hypothetical protein [Deltaproteobacteria bacterium]
MIATMTDEQFKKKISETEGAPLLALFIALYSMRTNRNHINEKINEGRYELIKAKVIDRLNSAIKTEE